MFKILKMSATMFLGMMIAPKRGEDLRKDAVNYLKKYRPKLKMIIKTIEDAWDNAQENKSEEIGVNVEYKIKEITYAARNLKENPPKHINEYESLKKIGGVAKKIGGEIRHSENAQKIAQELVKIAISTIDLIGDVSKKVENASNTIAHGAVVKKDGESNSNPLIKKKKN